MRATLMFLAVVVLILGAGSTKAELISCDDVSELLCAEYPACVGPYLGWLPERCVDGQRWWFCVWICEVEPCQWEYFYSDTTACDCTGEAQPCDCMLAGTPILLADGTTKPVEEIRTGDRVLAYDEATKSVGPSAVLDVHRPYVTTDYVVINEMIRVTENHPFLSKDEWVPAGRLRVGDLLTTADGEDMPIASIQRVGTAAMVYNFRVDALNRSGFSGELIP